MSRPRFWDPAGERFGIPTFPWKMAPDGLCTRRQLRARDLRPNGQPVAAQILWFSRRYAGGVRAAFLYRPELAAPVRPMTDARRRALAAANRARRMCPTCGLDAGYVLPAHLGCCLICEYGDPLAA
ncbi:RRQRL motif-containing zinc-binding protein [Streptomyces sp. NRRL B-24484]|uniref:RRQRL motif-containing zinc-binding protein n=1 Tax=Streptomyces sp. NRRL B-24484 TaxID=1463833 RepID=UPI0004C0181A|nr:RRQRL motif-containing zinc-binding protein [Streptomyces sp. NRRL B-24484]